MRGEPGVDRDHDRAEGERCIRELDELDAIGQVDEDAVTRTHTEPIQPGGDAADCRMQLGVAYTLRAADHG